MDIDADTGTVRPTPINEIRPVQLGSYPLNPQLATTIAWIAVGFVGCIIWQEWTNGNLSKRANKNFKL